MDWKEIIGDKKHFTDIDAKTKMDIMTERQWAKQGFVAKSENNGIFLYANCFHNGIFKYLHKDEVREATKNELDVFFFDEKKRRNELHKKYRERRIQEQEKEKKELQKRVDEARSIIRLQENELQQGRACFQELCKKFSKIAVLTDVIKTAEKIVLDTETTGFFARYDELLQVSVLDAETEEILFHSYIKPSFVAEWKESEKVNGITPDTVRDAPYIYQVLPTLNHIISKAKTIIAYNSSFDKGFLETYGVDFSSVESYIDVMQDFSVVYGQYNERHCNFTWKNLSVCADYLGYDWGEENAHDSLADCKATLYCYKELQKEKYIQIYENNLKNFIESEDNR